MAVMFLGGLTLLFGGALHGETVPVKNVIACFGKYPDSRLVMEAGATIEELPSEMLDKPLDYVKFSREYLMVACNLYAMTSEQIGNLSEYVRQGGVLHLFDNSAIWEDANANHQCDYGNGDKWWGGKQFLDLTQALQWHHSQTPRYPYINRLRVVNAHPICEGIPSGQWVEMRPPTSGSTTLHRMQLLSSCFSSVENEKDVLMEADLYKYRDNTTFVMTDETFRVAPVVILHQHGKGWVLWDATSRLVITVSGASNRFIEVNPVFNNLPSNLVKWAGSLKPRSP